MNVEMREELLNRETAHAAMTALASVPIAFEVREVLDPTRAERGSAEFLGSAEPIAHPWTKDYDAIPGNHPVDWSAEFELSGWGLISAWSEGRRLGSALIVQGVLAIDLLEGRDDLAVLWDLRVVPELRGRGVGTQLLRAAERWAARRECRHLKVETQTLNVPACRFYAHSGYELLRVSEHVYPNLPDEVQVLWCRDLAATARRETQQPARPENREPARPEGGRLAWGDQ
ncbi:MAG: GNAT family N-acetyltransferase [Candidatus Eisenbacteria bacterium]|nr:GNAT family N-acetyltransferase [Candidatus Eisenbacteria bacterium]